MLDWLEEGWAWVGLLVLAWLWGLIRRALGTSSGARRPPPVTSAPDSADGSGLSRSPRRPPVRRKARGVARFPGAAPGLQEPTRRGRPPAELPAAPSPAPAAQPATSASVASGPTWPAGLASAEGLLTAVILSEVLGPPRSRRPYRPGPRPMLR